MKIVYLLGLDNFLMNYYLCLIFYSLYVIMHLPIRFVVLFIDEARCLKCILEYF